MGLLRHALLAGVLATGFALRAQPDFNRPWDPAIPLPRFITHHYVNPAQLVAIAKYRSGAGHTYSDNYEPFDRSLKFYFEPLSKYLNTNEALPVFSPVTGTLKSITPEGHTLSNGDHRGFQLALSPDGYPAFNVILFHVNVAPGLAVGGHLNAGDPLGFADVREAVDFDLAVGAAWNATPRYTMIGQATVPRAPGYRLLPPVDVMTDECFADFVALGLADRSAFLVPLEYRNANPGKFVGVDRSAFDPVEFALLRPAPRITAPPGSVRAQPGSIVTLRVEIAPIDADADQVIYWRRNGDYFGPQTPRNELRIQAGPNGEGAGFYWVEVRANGQAVESTIATVTVATGGPSRLTNVSTRGVVPAGGALTPGFVLRGAGSKSLVIRAVGPTLGSAFGVAGALADPALEVAASGGGGVLLANDDWQPSAALNAASLAAGAFVLSAGSKDAAVLAPLNVAGTAGFSVRIGSGAARGVALAEVYDPEPLTSPTRLVNVSTLGHAGRGAEALTPGFVVGGTAPKRVLVRAVGPGLAPFGITGTLANPQLALVPLGKTFTIAANNDWEDGGQGAALAAAFASTGAFSLPPGSKDAAIVIEVPPGGYSVLVSDAGGGTGTVLVEVYDLDP